MAYSTSAEKGNIFILTAKGYDETPERVRKERKIGSPIKGFEYDVPTSWIEKGYVEERRES